MQFWSTIIVTPAGIKAEIIKMEGFAADPATPDTLRPLYNEEAERLAAAAERLAAIEDSLPEA